MAYGGPNSLDEIPGYLAGVLSGRPVPADVIERVRHNYQQIGGGSPLLEITARQVEALSERLNQQGQYKCYLGMRHWSPWIEDAVRDMLDDDVTRAISLVLTPHYSRMSVGQYHARVAAALQMYRAQVEFEHIPSYHDAPGYTQALAKRVREGLNRWDEQDAVHTVFSAHSLPARILETGDPYDSQARETARLVAQEAGLAEGQWSWSYQSGGRSRELWLGPQIEEHLIKLAQQGARNVLCVPVGFVSDHVETLHDLDIRARQVAQDHGLRFERPPALNVEPLFISALAELVHKQAISTQMNADERRSKISVNQCSSASNL